MGQESACFCGLNSSVRCQALLRSGLCGRGKIAPEEDGDWSESHQTPVSGSVSLLGEFKFRLRHEITQTCTDIPAETDGFTRPSLFALQIEAEGIVIPEVPPVQETKAHVTQVQAPVDEQPE